MTCERLNNMLVFICSLLLYCFLVMGLYEENKDVYGLIIDNIKNIGRERP